MLVLAGTALAIAWPVLTGGAETYMDNPVHLSEIWAAAHEAHHGWSDTAFCGFPVGTLHSPLWYGGLALLARAGWPADPLYAFCLLAGLLAPPLALYRVARRRTSATTAAALAYLLLVQRPAVVGIGSATGGMWTYYIAAAGVILLADRLARPCRSAGDLARIAGLVGLVLLTHLFALVPLGLLALVFVGLSFARKRLATPAFARPAAAGAIGLLASAAYWLPLFLAGEQAVRAPQHLAGAMVAARLLFPTHLFPLLEGAFPPLGPRAFAEAIPMLALAGLGAGGAARLGRRRDDLPLYGAALAALLLFLLMAIAPRFDVQFLGPVSWRLVYFVRVGLALAALALFDGRKRGAARPLPAPAGALLAAAALGAAFWWGAPLRAAVPGPRGAAMADVRSLWNWVAGNRDDNWGRLYLQDTFTAPRGESELEQSHVLALTARETGVRQLGPSYGIAPYRAAKWTLSEFGNLYGRRISGEGGIRTLRRLMGLSNATHIVVSDDASAATLGASPFFETLFRAGRFHLMAARGAESRWVDGAGGEANVKTVAYATGKLAFETGADYDGEVLIARVSHHPAWRLSGSDRATLGTDGSGLLRIDGLPAGPGRYELEFRPSPLPRLISLLGWIGVLALAFPPRG